MANLPSVSQQLAGAHRVVVGASAGFVRGDMGSEQPQLGSLVARVSFGEVTSPSSDRLDLAASQDDSDFERLGDGVLVPSSPIYGVGSLGWSGGPSRAA